MMNRRFAELAIKRIPFLTCSETRISLAFAKIGINSDSMDCFACLANQYFLLLNRDCDRVSIRLREG